jgi:signal transduction histidine kinase
VFGPFAVRFMKASVENKIVLGFVASVVALLGLGWLSYQTTQNLAVTEHWVLHTGEVIATLESGLAIIADAETAQRGYLLTGDARCLKECHDSQALVAGWISKIQSLTADNPAEQRRLEELSPLILQRMALLNNRIQLRQEQGFQAAVSNMAAHDNQELEDQIRRRIGEMSDAEKKLLVQRRLAAQDSAQINLTIILAGSTLACAVGLMAILLIHRDLKLRRHTEEKIRELNKDLEHRAAQLEAINKELEAFSYSVSHDLRAPLRHIDGFVKLLDRQAVEKLDERGKRYLDIIADSARRMGALIDDLLVFSRMSRAELRHMKVSSNSLIHEALDGLQSETTGRHINWKIGELPEIEADPAMFRQVWVNLISNAIKYTRPRDPAEIEIACADSRNGEYVFSVRDNGVGFDMQYAHKLFGVFQRLHRAEEFEGTGIGLANVSRIVHRHGGRAWAEGRLDAGATFYFSLPKLPFK